MASLHAAILVMALSGTGTSTGQTMLLDFYADWCGPCRGMDPTVRELMAKGYPVRRVNVDQERELAARFGVESIPCFVMLVDGREVNRIQGPTSLDQLERLCKAGPRAAPSRGPGLLAGLGCAKAGPGAAPTARPSLVAGCRVPAKAPAAAPRAMPGPAAQNLAAAPAAWTPRSPAVAPTDAALIAASVRLRVEDAGGHSCGTGAIIDAREGEALILTCGHIFRDSQGKGRIEVDLFGPAPAGQVPGRLIAYDLKRDLGLVSIGAPGPVVAARLAPPGYQVRQNDLVATVGCNNGEAPTVQHSRVNSLNKFLGPPNIQVAGQPVEGRSGGPLFSSDGLVIGVCNAADPSDREGLFAALGSIHSQLDEVSLSYVYQAPTRGAVPAAAVANAEPAGSMQAAPGVVPRVRFPTPNPESAVRPASLQVAADSPEASPLNPGEQSVLDDIHRRMKEGSEVLIISRNCRDPRSKSEVLMLDRASPGLIRQLRGEARAQDGPRETSLEVPKPRTPVLEWDINEGYRHGGPN